MAPHVVDDGEREWWVYEDKRAETMGLGAVAGKPREQWSREPVRFEEMLPSCYEPHLRAKDLRFSRHIR